MRRPKWGGGRHFREKSALEAAFSALHAILGGGWPRWAAAPSFRAFQQRRNAPAILQGQIFRQKFRLAILQGQIFRQKFRPAVCRDKFSTKNFALRCAGTNFPPKISPCGVQGQIFHQEFRPAILQGQKFGVKARQFLQKHQRKDKDMPPPETTKLEIPEWTGSGLSNGDHLAYAKDLYNIYSKGDYTPLSLEEIGQLLTSTASGRSTRRAMSRRRTPRATSCSMRSGRRGSAS